MNNMTPQMKERIEKWESRNEPKDNKPKLQTVRRPGKGDFGDANSIEELEFEHRSSQTRR